MASPYGVTLCKRFTNKYVPVVIGLRANNVRPYGYACADGLHGAPGSAHPTVRPSITLTPNYKLCLTYRLVRVIF